MYLILQQELKTTHHHLVMYMYLVSGPQDMRTNHPAKHEGSWKRQYQIIVNHLLFVMT